jgi:two-component system response regulator YesN
MIKVLIIDDEPIIVESIKSRLQRLGYANKLQFYGCSDPLEALKLFSIYSPDICIVDIRMPKLNGVDLINLMQKEKHNCRFIVISAYDDYAYMRNAFRAGVKDYLLKPVNSTQLKEVIDQIINDLEMHNNNIEFSENYIEEESAFITWLLKKDEIYPSKVQCIKSKLRACFPNRYFVILIVTFDNDNYSIYIENIVKIISDLIRDVGDIKFEISTDIKDYIVVLAIIEKVNYLNSLKAMCKKLILQVTQKVGLNVAVSLSYICENIEDLPSVFEQAQLCLTSRYKEGYGKVYAVWEMPRCLEVDKCKVKRYLKRINLCENLLAIKGLIEEIFYADLKELNVAELKELYKLIVRKIEEAFTEYEIELPYSDIKNFESFYTIEELKSYLYYLIDYFQNQNSIHANHKRQIIQMAMEFIRNKPIDKVNLNEVADYLNVSYPYLSKIFREQTGMTFREYIKYLKMLHAQELLNDPRNRVQEIADKLGYESPYHFTRAFKKFFGISPSEFRNQNAKGNR